MYTYRYKRSGAICETPSPKKYWYPIPELNTIKTKNFIQQPTNNYTK